MTILLNTLCPCLVEMSRHFLTPSGQTIVEFMNDLALLVWLVISNDNECLAVMFILEQDGELLSVALQLMIHSPLIGQLICFPMQLFDAMQLIIHISPMIHSICWLEHDELMLLELLQLIIAALISLMHE